MNKESERVKKWVLSKDKVCPFCNQRMHYKSRTCKNCTWNLQDSDKIKNSTIGEYREKRIKEGSHPSWINVEIRRYARQWNDDLRKLPCKFCGYNKHVEICHIKPISEFKDWELMGEVNSKDNVIQLCPNCHWEFDNNINKTS